MIKIDQTPGSFAEELDDKKYEFKWYTIKPWLGKALAAAGHNPKHFVAEWNTPLNEFTVVLQNGRDGAVYKRFEKNSEDEQERYIYEQCFAAWTYLGLEIEPDYL